jgi:hypothetical protein
MSGIPPGQSGYGTESIRHNYCRSLFFTFPEAFGTAVNPPVDEHAKPGIGKPAGPFVGLGLGK